MVTILLRILKKTDLGNTMCNEINVLASTNHYINGDLNGDHELIA